MDNLTRKTFFSSLLAAVGVGAAGAQSQPTAPRIPKPRNGECPLCGTMTAPGMNAHGQIHQLSPWDIEHGMRFKKLAAGVTNDESHVDCAHCRNVFVVFWEE